jgi:HK97 family phage major capsid protein
MPAAWRRTAVWLAHPDVEPQLLAAGLQVASADGTSVTGGQLVYKPAGSIADSPFGTLFGRPIIPTQAAQALGTTGDLIFWAPSQYAVFSRGEGLRFDSSIHLWFDQGVTAFRFTLRIGGQPWWSSPISPKNGSTTASSIVTLATRS